MKEKEWISKEKVPLGFLYDFSDDKVIRPFFFLAESVLLFLVGEALQQRNLFSNCKNHFRKRSTWALVQLCGYCYFGVSTDKKKAPARDLMLFYNSFLFNQG